MHLRFQTFRLHPPHAPLARRCFSFRSGLASDSPGGLSAVLRTSFTARSLVSRIRPYRVCIVSRHWAHRFYGLSVHFQLLSTSPRGQAVTFSCWRLAPPERDFHPPAQAHSQAHERDRPGRTARRLAERNSRTAPERVFGGTPNTAGETPALPGQSNYVAGQTTRAPRRNCQFQILNSQFQIGWERLGIEN